MKNSALSLDLFTQVESDFEIRQYKVLAALKQISDEFRQNRIYPNLSELVELRNTLADIRTRLEDLRNDFPKRIKNIDLVNKIIEHEVVFVDGSDLSKVEDLIEWALPHIEAKIKEGKAIYEYVDEEIKIEEVGILPSYVDEGYFFVPDNEEAKLLLFQYEVSIFQSAQDQYRALKTGFLKALHQGQAQLSPNSIKLDLIKERKELPNPATYSFHTKLDFPFRETIFPVVKRKLMQQLSEAS
ncbi:hypothetical protein NC796_25245 [Aliifodinibius sp. S!AR15-10]|uniref:hypothetical protein n=1 Tax=Aliifodinibius sp. S!AR15-10 TaxID=2950437 RepID=UPI002855A6B7|nr:hypothetical protein [Aliifodinibius sp. S!AR15-10]MDR8394477.1 hypothetical protein [Aliifodinibius sp. S!AR15-10]